MKHLDELHAEDIEAYAEKFNLEELEEIFFCLNNEFFVYDDIDQHKPTDRLSIAKEIIQKIDADIETIHEELRDYPNNEQYFHIVENIFNKSISDIGFLSLMLEYRIFMVIYKYHNREIDNCDFLKKFIKIQKDYYYLWDIYSEELLKDYRSYLIKDARTSIGKIGAYKRHLATNKRRDEAIAHFFEENEETGISKNEFAKKYAEKYFQAEKTVRRWLQGDIKEPIM